MIVLDTHSWIWWLDQPSRLSAPALRALGEISEASPVAVSAISVWELYMLVGKERLVLRTDPAHWVRQCELSPKTRFIPIDNEIARISVQLPDDFPDDPADRLIAATAISLGATLVSKDAKIRASRALRVVW